MKPRYFFVLASLIAFLGCFKERFLQGKTSLYEDFELVQSAEELFETDNWVFYQQTEPNSYLVIDTSMSKFGAQCLLIKAASGTVSKSDLANNKLALPEGESVRFSGWFYLDDTLDLGYVFLVDIEESVVIGAGPGVRVAINADDYLVIERNKFGEPTLSQSPEDQTPFPRQQWVHIELEMGLSQQKKGYVKLWQNNELLIQASNVRTMPKDELYHLQGSKGVYQSLQVGLTAVTADHDVFLYLDAIEFELLD
jgi:hypothetical protein